MTCLQSRFNLMNGFLCGDSWPEHDVLLVLVRDSVHDHVNDRS